MLLRCLFLASLTGVGAFTPASPAIRESIPQQICFQTTRDDITIS